MGSGAEQESWELVLLSAAVLWPACILAAAMRKFLDTALFSIFPAWSDIHGHKMENR